MKNKIIAPIVSLIIIPFFMLLSCKNKDSGNNANQNEVSGETRVIKDMVGYTITLPKKLERVALLGGPTGQIAYILGVQDRLCAVTKSITTSELVQLFDPSIKTRPVARTVNGMVHVEVLLKSNPQLVIAGNLDGQIVEKKTDIPVAYFEDSISHGLKEITSEINFYASVFEAEDRADAYIRYLTKTIDFIKKRTADVPDIKRKVIYNGYSASHLVTVGGDTFMQERVEVAGCRNAAESIRTTGKKEGLHSGLGEVSMEQVLAWDPDIIVIDMGSLEELRNDARWAAIKAVKNRKVFVQPVGVFIWDRPTAEAAVLHPLWLAKTAYPDRFKDMSFTEEARNFYREIFKFNLTEKQAELVTNGYFKTKMVKGFK